MSNEPQVFLVENDDMVLDSMSMLLRTKGFAVCCHGSAEAFLQSDAQREVGCLALDARLPGLSGLELASEITSAGSPLQIILISGYVDEEVTAASVRCGATVLQKPIDADELVRHVESCLDSVD